jgi:hypothetical protein
MKVDTSVIIKIDNNIEEYYWEL